MLEWEIERNEEQFTTSLMSFIWLVLLLLLELLGVRIIDNDHAPALLIRALSIKKYNIQFCRRLFFLFLFFYLIRQKNNIFIRHMEEYIKKVGRRKSIYDMRHNFFPMRIS